MHHYTHTEGAVPGLPALDAKQNTYVLIQEADENLSSQY